MCLHTRGGSREYAPPVAQKGSVLPVTARTNSGANNGGRRSNASSELGCSTQNIRNQGVHIDERERKTAEWKGLSNPPHLAKEAFSDTEADEEVHCPSVSDVCPPAAESHTGVQSIFESQVNRRKEMARTSRTHSCGNISSTSSTVCDDMGNGRPRSRPSLHVKSGPWDRRRGWGSVDAVSMLRRIQDLADHLRRHVSRLSTMH